MRATTLTQRLLTQAQHTTSISQAVADWLGPEAVWKRKPPEHITAVNGEPLHSTAVLRQMVGMRDSARAKQGNAINFVIANIIRNPSGIPNVDDGNQGSVTFRPTSNSVLAV